jgi:chromosome partitioning protein
MRIISGYNIKGGVGKTATVVNLAYLCAKEGYKTLVWDLDPQGAASYYFRVKSKVKGGGRRLLEEKAALGEAIKGTDYSNLDLLPSDFSYRNMDFLLENGKKPENRLRKVLQQIVGEYDFIFLDCAPGISLTSENILRASNVVIVPTIPTTLSLRTLSQLIKFTKSNKITDMVLIPLFSMVDRRKTIHRLIVNNPPKTPDLALVNWIPYASDVEKMGIHRQPIGSFAPFSVAAQAYEAVWAELKMRMKIK